ncbi:MAG: type II toxin-antitoxin system RelE/ParE family toxin [Clostridiales bacterium]|nr:type II toxin-antitoxin system RelE/ParE family toxin [Clostridiales bacterium]
MKSAIDWRINTETQLYTIKINEAAELDLENAGDYIAYELLNPQAAENTVRGIREQVNKLQNFPTGHELDDDPILAELGVRRTYYKEYKIFYTVDQEHHVVNVVRILHMLVDSRVRLYRTFHIK